MNDLSQPAGELLVASRAGDDAVLRIDRGAELNAPSPDRLPEVAGAAAFRDRVR